MFIGGNARQAVAEGRGDFIPIFLSEIPMLFRRQVLPLDVALVHVSMPDKHGFCSMGVSVDATRSATQNAKYIIGELFDCSTFTPPQEIHQRASNEPKAPASIALVPCDFAVVPSARFQYKFTFSSLECPFSNENCCAASRAKFKACASLKEHYRIGFASKTVAGSVSTLYVIHHIHKLTNL